MMIGRFWMFEETGEVRKPLRGEWFRRDTYQFSEKESKGIPVIAPDDFVQFSLPILKLSEYRSNPLTPIREVANRKETDAEKRLIYAINNPKLSKKVSEDFVTLLSEIRIYREAICETMAILEGK